MNSPFVRAFLEKLKEPLLPAHLANFFVSIIVVTSVANSRALNASGEDSCGFNEVEAVCSFTSFISTFAILLSVVFIVMEFQWERLGSYHRWIYLGELCVASAWSFFFFCACASLVLNWKGEIKHNTSIANGNVAIIFSLCASISWLGLAYFSYKGYKEDDIVLSDRRVSSYMDPVTAPYHQGGGNVV